ncbi:hypothetical protein DEO72_LG8g1459 [Vigna unguiculata]|uniref:Uncharacterized protein n=1 Tax=Vigna unguiculata TaxID=3917 RepID=A0A4D6MU61_VIGUN|nr:hypothetical protein DEO72_LG8g1459 [Vigna unguiculata]
MYKLELSILQNRCLKRVDNESGAGYVRNGVMEKEFARISWIMDNSDLEQEVLSLQEQLRVEKDLRVVLEVQDEKWRLGMDDKFGVKEWKFFDLLKRARPIQRNLVNGKAITKIIKNPVKGKLAKVKMKSVKEKMKSVKEKIKSDKEKIKSIKEKSKSAMEIEDCSGQEKKKN